jgi:hypothetical protein
MAKLSPHLHEWRIDQEIMPHVQNYHKTDFLRILADEIERI